MSIDFGLTRKTKYGYDQNKYVFQKMDENKRLAKRLNGISHL